MPEIGTPGLMSGDGKRGVGHRPQATAPILDSTGPTRTCRGAPTTSTVENGHAVQGEEIGCNPVIGPAKEAALLRNLLHNFRLAWKLPRWRWALLTAVLSDALGFTVVLFPPMEWLLDGATAIVLFVVLGFRWPLLAALVTEAVPGLQLFPAWTLVVLALAATEAEGSERGY